jgi:predicted peptidase
VFLHGLGQSHDYIHFAGDLSADVKSPLLANQGGITWIEKAKERSFVLIPQMPAWDTKDPAGEAGWRNAETTKLLLGLVDKLIAENAAINSQRLYLTGLSMGGMGTWKIISDPDPAISMKFAAAVIVCGIPKYVRGATGDTPVQKNARIIDTLKGLDYRNVKIPLWLFHGDADPLVDRLGARVPFAILTGKASIGPGGELIPASGTLKRDTGLARYYAAANAASGHDVRYTEYPYGTGTRFRDLGMVTQNGHFTWEPAYKDQAMIDWMFSQAKK